MKIYKILIVFFIFLLFQTNFPFIIHAQSLLTWTDCLREAAQNQPKLIVTQEQTVQSQADKRIIFSGILPQISADLNALTGNSSTGGYSKDFEYGVSGSLLLFDGLKTPHALDAASERIKATQENYKFTSSNIRLILREAFIDLLKAQQLIVLTEEIYQLRKSNLELIALRYESGTEHKGALLTAKANLSQAVFEINAAKRGLEITQKRLSKELGREKFSPFSVAGDFDLSLDFAVNPDFESIAQRNSALLQITAQKNAAENDVKASRGDFLPTLVLTGHAGKSENLWPPDDNNHSVALKASVPLFSGGVNVARLAKVQSVYRQLQEEERSKRDDLVYLLEKSWSDLADASEKVKVQKDFLAASQERAKIAQSQYSMGLITFDNWTIIEDDLVGARKTLLDIQAAALLAQANWVQAKGETLEYEN